MEQVIEQARILVRHEFAQDASGHDYWHLERVQRSAARIGNAEGANPDIVSLGAWLHDMADPKLSDPDTVYGRVEDWLRRRVDDHTKEAVLHIMRTHSWSAYKRGEEPETLEAKVVFDADKLDAIGAVGIARAFATGAVMGRPLHDPWDLYSGTIGHFYDKLLQIKDALYTPTARRIAEERHAYMQDFLTQFYNEWASADGPQDPQAGA